MRGVRNAEKINMVEFDVCCCAPPSTPLSHVLSITREQAVGDWALEITVIGRKLCPSFRGRVLSDLTVRLSSPEYARPRPSSFDWFFDEKVIQPAGLERA